MEMTRWTDTRRHSIEIQYIHRAFREEPQWWDEIDEVHTNAIIAMDAVPEYAKFDDVPGCDSARRVLEFFKKHGRSLDLAALHV